MPITSLFAIYYFTSPVTAEELRHGRSRVVLLLPEKSLISLVLVVSPKLSIAAILHSKQTQRQCSNSTCK